MTGSTARLRFVALALMAGACGGNAASDPSRLVVGFFPNVTHAVPLVAIGRGSIDAALAPVHVEWHAFSAGPAAMEALLSGALDACYVGPGPALMAYLRTHGEALVVVAGAVEGGAGLVVRRSLGIHAPGDLRHRTLATPQLGNTQDIALRTWLHDVGLESVDHGGDVRVVPLSNARALVLMKRGDIDGAWVPEPWLSRMLVEADGALLVDEKSRWPGGRYPSTVLVATRAAMARKPETIAKLVAAHVDEVRWIRAHDDEARALAAGTIRARTGLALPDDEMRRAWANVTPSWDPLPSALARMYDDGRALRYLPDGSVDALLDRRALDGALAARGLAVDGGAP